MRDRKSFSYFLKVIILASVVFVTYYFYTDFLIAGPVKIGNKRIVSKDNFKGVITVTNVPGIKFLTIDKSVTNFYTNQISNKSLTPFFIEKQFLFQHLKIYIDISVGSFGGYSTSTNFTPVEPDTLIYLVDTNYFETFNFFNFVSNVVSGKASLTSDILFMDENQVVGGHSLNLYVTNFLSGSEESLKTNQIYVVDRLPPFLRKLTYMIRDVEEEQYGKGPTNYRADDVYIFDVDDLVSGAKNLNTNNSFIRIESVTTQVTCYGGVSGIISASTNIVTNVSIKKFTSENSTFYVVPGANVWVILEDYCGNVVTNKIK